MDPDSNKVIVITDRFEVSTGEVIQVIHTNFGPRADDLKKMESSRIKQIIELNAEKLAEQKLVIKAAEEKGITINDAQLDSLIQTQYNQVGGEEVFLNYLQKNGISIDQVRKDIADSYVMQQYMQSVLDEEYPVSDKDLQDKYRQMIQKDRTASVQHILLMTQGKSAAEKEEIYKKMRKIHARAKNGEDFAELAKTYSEDPGSKNKGGLYENFERGTMVKPFEDAAFSVPIGEISEIVETQYGYHILKIVDRKKESRSFEEVKPDLVRQLRKSNESQLVKNHLDQLKENAGYSMMPL
jgi:parvulin-like peptidyl-prolyl isomerase